MTHSFVHKFIRIFAPLLISLFLQATRAESEKPSDQKPVKIVARGDSKILPKPIDFFSKKKMELIQELDEIMREMIWLIRSERPTANKTLYGKVFRALQQAKGAKLKEKNRHTCDQYTLEQVSEYQYRIYEHCQKHRAPDLLAKLDWSKNHVGFQFQGQNYSDVLGLAASLVAPAVDCQVVVDDAIKLISFTCSGLRMTRADTVVRLETVNYRKDKDPLMYLKGEVLKNLLPYSDLTVSVPLTGKVKILERKKAPDIDEITPEMKEKLKAKKPKVAPVPVPIDPSIPTVPAIYPGPQKIPKSPREQESPATNEDTNNDLLKNSDPDVIPIQEPNTTR